MGRETDDRLSVLCSGVCTLHFFNHTLYLSWTAWLFYFEFILPILPALFTQIYHSSSAGKVLEPELRKKENLDNG